LWNLLQIKSGKEEKKEYVIIYANGQNVIKKSDSSEFIKIDNVNKDA